MDISPIAPGTRPGHFVDGRYFPLSHGSQARARAAHLAQTYGRPVYVVTRRVIGGEAHISESALNTNSASALFLTCIGA